MKTPEQKVIEACENSDAIKDLFDSEKINFVCFGDHCRFFRYKGNWEAWTTRTRYQQSEKLIYKGKSLAMMCKKILKKEVEYEK